MIGAIGSVYEGDRVKHTEFPLFSEWCRFTDDTVLTVATAHALLTGRAYADAYHDFFRRYPHAGYGGACRARGTTIKSLLVGGVPFHGRLAWRIGATPAGRVGRLAMKFPREPRVASSSVRFTIAPA